MEKILKTNCVDAVIILLKELKVRVTKSTIKESLKNHAHFPSLLAVSDKLKSWKIANEAFQIQKEDLSKIESPFLAQVHMIIDDNLKKYGVSDKKADSLFVVVKQISGTHVTYTDPQNNMRWTTITTSEFLEFCSGIILVVKALENAGDKNYAKERIKDFINHFALFILFTLGILIIAFQGYSIFKELNNSILFLLSLGIKSLGILVCIALLKIETGNSNNLLKSVCSLNQKTNCNAVLESKGSKLLGLFSWSLIGLSYFTGTLCLLVFGKNIEEVIKLNYLLNFLAFPYIFYSIIYQWKIIKQWCVFCLVIQLLLLFEFILPISSNYFSNPIPNFDLFEIIFNSLIIISPFSLIILVNQTINKNKDNQNFKRELFKIKNNKEIFSALLQNEKAITTQPSSGIILGSEYPKYTIIKVCNPYCGPCGKVHPILDKLLEENHDIRLHIVFYSSTHESDLKFKTVSFFMTLSRLLSENQMKEALSKWYNSPNKNLDEFIAQYPLAKSIGIEKDLVSDMHQWCKDNEITATPTIFINGKKLPEMYTPEELLDLLD